MKSSLLAAAALLVSAAPAHALCVYRGDLYGQSTLQGELAESRRVVKATVIDERPMQPWGEDGEVGSLYTLRVEQTFKGAPTPTIAVFTERNSGGFYLDTGETYLLFLTDSHRPIWRPHVGNAFRVNYNCGQSRPWIDIPAADRARLMK